MILETIAEEPSPHITRGGLRDMSQPSMWSEEATRDPPRPALSSHIRQTSQASAAPNTAELDEMQQSL